MKKIIFLFLLTICSMSTFAQDLDITTINKEKYLVIRMQSEQAGYENVEIMMNERHAEVFAKRLKLWSRRMANKFHSIKGKNNQDVPIPGSSNFDYIYFSEAGVTGYSLKGFFVPTIHLDELGGICLRLRGYYNGKEYALSKVKRRCEFNFTTYIPAHEVNDYISRVENKLLDIR